MQRTGNDKGIDLPELVRRAKRLDSAAFNQMVELYAPRLAGFFQRMLGHRMESDDFVQEVFLRVVRGIGDYQENGRFEAWLFSIAGNLARQVLRGRRMEAGPWAESKAPADAKGPVGQRLGQKEDADRLQRCLDELAEGEREVILLRHFGGLTFEEIARLVEAPLGTVLARGHRGLAKLRQKMESCDERS